MNKKDSDSVTNKKTSHFTIEPFNSRKRRYSLIYLADNCIYYCIQSCVYFSKYDKNSPPHSPPSIKNKRENSSSNQTQFDGFHTAKTELVCNLIVIKIY